MTQSKSVLKSKTFWTAVGTAALMFEPTVHAMAATNPSPFFAGIAGLFFLLRLFTGQPISFKSPDLPPGVLTVEEPTIKE
jgi:hypothetical protein